MVDGTDADDVIYRMRIVRYKSMQSEGRDGMSSCRDRLTTNHEIFEH